MSLNDNFKQRMHQVRESEIKHNSQKIKDSKRDHDKYPSAKYTEEEK